jgi:hypothetical protein
MVTGYDLTLNHEPGVKIVEVKVYTHAMGFKQISPHDVFREWL